MSDAQLDRLNVVDESDQRIRRIDQRFSEVRVVGGRALRLTFVGCEIDRLTIDSTEELELQVNSCSIGVLELRRLPATDPTGVAAVIGVNGVRVNELHLESSVVSALQLKRLEVSGLTFLRSVKLRRPEYAVITNCHFAGAFYADLSLLGRSDINHTDIGLDLRQNEFTEPVKLGIALDGAERYATSVSLRGCRFDSGLRLRCTGPAAQLDATYVAVSGDLDLVCTDVRTLLDGATLSGRAAISLRRSPLRASRAQLRGGGRLESDGSLELDGIVLAQPTTIAGVDVGAPPPQLLDLRGSQVGPLRLLGVDMRACHLADALGLEAVTVDCSPELWPVLDRRRVIADEIDLRKGACEHPLRTSAVPSPVAIASCYRQLRTSLAAVKDQPGAADFYYGEMDMRRQSAAASTRVFRVMLWIYWFTSGYGVRAGRAVATLLAVLAIGGLVLAEWGLAGRVGGQRTALGLLTAVELATLRSSPQPLTDVGRAIAIPLRLIAPLVFLQLILAVRSRISR